MMNLKLANVLYVDDEIHNLNSFRAAFRKDFNVFTAISAEEGLEVLEENEMHVVITDQRMPYMTGIEFLAQISEKYVNVVGVLLTGFEDANLIADALHKRLAHFSLEKPWDEDEIRSIVGASFGFPPFKHEH
ncbi:response regulator [Dyadobacter sp. CY261]|uniref:response regulator n=1 Tax=Dyadobacter sp. CY261 TaxID=2907203 RepID=UPI001F2516FD|nr:response regulator [Dyadobacter sp. CY261]MCF0070620.1 response regulator [Dyadobacter sp. CY261]